MFTFKPILIALYVLVAFSTSIVQSTITEDSHIVVKWPRGVGQHAVQVVGDPTMIDIYATNYKTIYQAETKKKVGISSTGKCKKLTNIEQKTFQAPCTFTTNKHDQSFQAECVNGKGAASIYFPKQGTRSKQAVVSTSGQIWAGFSNKKKEHLKQGELLNKGYREVVILNCNGNSRGRF